MKFPSDEGPIDISEEFDISSYIELEGLEAISGTGHVVRSGVGTYVTRTITAGANISIGNGDGVLGNPTIALTGIGTTIQAWDADLDAIAALASTGIAVRTASNTWAQRSIAGTTNRITLTDGSGVAGNPTVDIASTYVGQSSITTLGTIGTGVWQGTPVADSYIASAATWNSKQPGDATLTALAAYNTNGFLVQTAADTFAGRTITGTANEITLTNGDGVSGNPVVSLPSAITLTGKTITGGTYVSISSLLVGASSNRTSYAVTPPLQTEAISAGSSGASFTLNAANAEGVNVLLTKTRSASLGGNTIVQSGDTLGNIYGVGANGVDTTNVAARIRFFVAGTPGVGDMPGGMSFSTTSDGSSFPVVRYTIASTAAAVHTFAGTAAFNSTVSGAFNGTLGATTPSTVAATTGSFSGNVGIGTTPSATVPLLVLSENAATPETVTSFGNATIAGALQVITSDGNVVWGFNALNSRSLEFQTNQTQRYLIGNTGVIHTLTGQAAIRSGLTSLLVGADSAASTITDSTDKFARISVPHYTNSEEPMGLMMGISNATTNAVYIGGGTSLQNAATAIRFWTAANNTTTVGTERWVINNGGHFLGSTDNTYDIGASGATRPRSGYFGTGVNTPLVSSNAASALSLATSGGTQVQVAHTASADRYITLTGSNGGNPTISTSAGSLAVGTSITVTGDTTTSGSFKGTTLDSAAASDTLIKRNGTTGITVGASSLVTLAGALTINGNVLMGTQDAYDFGSQSGSDRPRGLYMNYINFKEQGAAMPDPTTNVQCGMYMRNDKLAVVFVQDGGAPHYYTLDLRSSSGSWAYGTVAP